MHQAHENVSHSETDANFESTLPAAHDAEPNRDEAAVYAAALAAYQRFPDVNPLEPDLEHQFRQHYYGSYATANDLLRAIYELDAAEAAIDHIADTFNVTGAVHLDHQLLWRRAVDAWDIVYEGEWFHVFEPGPDQPEIPPGDTAT